MNGLALPLLALLDTPTKRQLLIDVREIVDREQVAAFDGLIADSDVRLYTRPHRINIPDDNGKNVKYMRLRIVS